MTDWHLAQINVATARFPLDDPRMLGFTDQLDAVNALADASPGFIWRLQSDSGNATDILVSDDPQFIINMSVWQGIDALHDYVYRTAHAKVFARRRDWFVPASESYQVLWWIPAGHIPTPAEGLERLDLLRAQGPHAAAFTFKTRFPPPADAAA